VVEEGGAKSNNDRLKLESPVYAQDLALWIRDTKASD